MRIKHLVLFLSIIFCANYYLLAQADFNIIGLDEISHYWNGPISIATQDSLVFVLDDRCLSILKARGTDQDLKLSYVSDFDVPGQDMVVSGNYVYTVGHGLIVTDISDIQNPVIVRTVGVGTNWCKDIVKNGNYLYISNLDTGMHIIDVTNPEQAHQVGFFSTIGNCWSLDIKDNYVYLSDINMLKIIDVTNPANPIQVGFCSNSHSVSGVCVQGDYAYISDLVMGDSGLSIFNISNPSEPFQTGFLQISFGSFRIGVQDSLVFVTGYDSSTPYLKIISVFDPTNPIEIYSFEGRYNGFVYYQNSLLVTNLARTIDVFNIRDSMNASRKYLYVNDPYIAIAKKDNYLYTLGDYGGFKVINASDPGNLEEIGMCRIIPDNVHISGEAGISIQDNLAFVINSFLGIIWIDISDPTSPQVIDNLYILPYSDFVFDSGYIFVSMQVGGICVINISSNPASIVNYCTEVDSIKEIALNETKLFALDENNVMHIFQKNSSSLAEIGSYIFPNDVRCLTAYNNYLYYESNYSIKIMDVSIPENPIVISTISNQGTIKEMKIIGHFLYVISINRGLLIFDLINPNHPILTGKNTTAGRYAHMNISENYMFAVQDKIRSFDCQNALSIEDCLTPEPESMMTINNYPNPFNTSVKVNFHIPLSGKTSLEIFNIKGQLVQTLVNESKSKGDYCTLWNGRDQHNVGVASGIYFAKLKRGNQELVKKLILLK